MVRVTKFRRPSGHWYVRFWINGQPTDESVRTKSEHIAETYRIRREMEINAGIQPLKHAEVGSLVVKYLKALPPKTSKSHLHTAQRMLEGFLKICGRKRRDGSSRLQTERINPELIDKYISQRQAVQLYNGEEQVCWSGDLCAGRRVVFESI